VIAHASRFVRPGAQRIESSGAEAALANVAFRNQDDGSIVLIVDNWAGSPREVLVRCRDREFRYTLPERSVATFVWGGTAR
jgi:glucosylceramidase